MPRQLATLCYVRAAGRTLMLHRVKKTGDMHAGKWNGLGGKLEPGETPDACARREIREESGLSVGTLRLHGCITFPHFRGDEDWYVWVFSAGAPSGTLIDSPEGELAWIPDAELPDLNLWPGDRIFLPWLRRPDFFSACFVYTEGILASHHVTFYPPGAADSEPAGPPSA